MRGRSADYGHRESESRRWLLRWSTPAGSPRLHLRTRGRRALALPLRCRRNIIVVNSGHRDFVFATRNRALQLRYLVRLYVKELVLKNFAGFPADQLLERMIELSLYAEEKLKSG